MVRKDNKVICTYIHQKSTASWIVMSLHLMIFEQIQVDILTSSYDDLDDIQKWKVFEICCQKFQIL
ncbi:hypothetical protein SADUNF_Sadunf02G0154300 [Salix dunnii]|uniref:Uncharacterized protein n=1 Tax=Salix dunnii TaxID=1413687 RepID=A0A835N838_9ROSI|nr:hypothetical protein SADUNF_Sadunf02G0154300 [Salix dunnii]